MRRAAARATRDRILGAATDLFARRGFHGTTIREIAQHAGVNVASGNYHFGSKKALYLEVLRAQFRGIRAELARRGAAPPPRALARLGPPALMRLLRSRVQVMLDLLLGPPPGPYGMLMLREMCDPSEALPIIVAEFITPMRSELAGIVARLFPALDSAAVERCVFSVTGQALFYRLAMPALLHLHGWTAYPPGITRELAAHVAAFSLGGMERMAVRGGRRRRRAR